VEDAGGEAEDDRVDKEPHSPEQVRGPRRVGSRRAAMRPDPGQQAGGRQRQEPADLAADLAVEETDPARLAAEAAEAACASTTRALSSEDASQAVVPQHQVEDGVVGAAADEWPRHRRDRIDDAQPPSARHDKPDRRCQ
jgi:hypothetical protein